ncbi:MAG: hypothetical protein HA496_10380 [Thaumarchaeota archaeon]|nr:hypothetical protein [Nitrososphaerota archaeon]
MLYPFSLGFLASLTTFLNIDNPRIVALSVGSFLIYLALAAYSFKWLIREVVGIGFESLAAATRTEVKEVSINPGPPWLGIVKKDLRMASARALKLWIDVEKLPFPYLNITTELINLGMGLTPKSRLQAS